MSAGLDPRTVRNVELAVACGAPPAMVLAVALASLRPGSVDQAIDLTSTHAEALRGLASAGARLPRSLASLEPELCFSPELARIIPGAGDHELRGQWLFRDILGRKSFFQVAALAIAGLELSAADAELLEHQGVITQLADAGIWPLNVTRRIGFGGDLAHAVFAGVGMLLNPNMAVTPVRDFMLLLDRLEAGQVAGRSIEEQLEDAVSRGERLPGVGRPVVGPDERNAHTIEYVRRFSRDKGASWRAALTIDEFFAQRKGQHINGAGLQGALLRDMGFSPSAGMAMCILYFMVPILAQAVFAVDRNENGRDSAEQ